MAPKVHGAMRRHMIGPPVREIDVLLVGSRKVLACVRTFLFVLCVVTLQTSVCVTPQIQIIEVLIVRYVHIAVILGVSVLVGIALSVRKTKDIVPVFAPFVGLQ